MKSIVALRHSIEEKEKNDPPLSEEGIKLAIEVGATLAIHFSEFRPIIVSDRRRAKETAEAIIEGAHHFLDFPEFEGDELIVEPELFTPWPKRWRAAGGAEGVRGVAQKKKITLPAALFQVNPILYMDEMARVTEVYLNLFEQMTEDQVRLVISHSPLIELAMIGLTGKNPGEVLGLKECEGYILTPKIVVEHLVLEAGKPIVKS